LDLKGNLYPTLYHIHLYMLRRRVHLKQIGLNCSQLGSTRELSTLCCSTTTHC